MTLVFQARRDDSDRLEQRPSMAQRTRIETIW